jgi:hypothetical protein
MNSKWPQLSYEKGRDTYQTLHLFSQVVGKIKLARLPWINHSWHVALFLTPFGITTGNIPNESGNFQIDFDFKKHVLRIITDDGETRELILDAM